MLDPLQQERDMLASEFTSKLDKKEKKDEREMKKEVEATQVQTLVEKEGKAGMQNADRDINRCQI